MIKYLLLIPLIALTLLLSGCSDGYYNSDGVLKPNIKENSSINPNNYTSYFTELIPNNCWWKKTYGCYEELIKSYPQYKGYEINNTALVPELCRFKIEEQQFHWDATMDLYCLINGEKKYIKTIQGEEVGGERIFDCCADGVSEIEYRYNCASTTESFGNYKSKYCYD